VRFLRALRSPTAHCLQGLWLCTYAQCVRAISKTLWTSTPVLLSRDGCSADEPAQADALHAMTARAWRAPHRSQHRMLSAMGTSALTEHHVAPRFPPAGSAAGGGGFSFASTPASGGFPSVQSIFGASGPAAATSLFGARLALHGCIESCTCVAEQGCWKRVPVVAATCRECLFSEHADGIGCGLLLSCSKPALPPSHCVAPMHHDCWGP